MHSSSPVLLTLDDVLAGALQDLSSVRILPCRSLEEVNLSTATSTAVDGHAGVLASIRCRVADLEVVQLLAGASNGDAHRVCGLIESTNIAGAAEAGDLG